jgi:hypothetical protein
MEALSAIQASQDSGNKFRMWRMADVIIACKVQKYARLNDTSRASSVEQDEGCVTHCHKSDHSPPPPPP